MSEQRQYDLFDGDGHVYRGDLVWEVLKAILAENGDGEWELRPVEVTAVSLSQLADALCQMREEVEGRQAFALDLHGNGTDVLTQTQWAARGEEYGNDALFVLVHDGGVLAPYCNPDYEDYAAYEALKQALAKLRLWAEQCTCWYTAVYPLESA